MFLPVLAGMAIVEVLALIGVARVIGWPWALVLLLGISLLGTRLLGIQRRVAIERLSRAVSEHRASAREAIDGALGFLGAVLLVVPGFVTDVLGALLLFGPTRSLARRWLARRYGARVMRFAAAAERFGPGGRGAPLFDVESTAVERDPDQLDR
jgi:UPF0716 protein FxsA